MTFSTPPASLTALHLSLTSLASQTGFCALLELVHLSAEGKIVRGSWTPVGNGSGGGRKVDLEGGAVYSSNPFAALGGAAAPVPASGPKVWGNGSLVGASFNRVSPPLVTSRQLLMIWTQPPRAVFAPQGTLDRPELGSLNPTPRMSREATPENWEEEGEVIEAPVVEETTVQEASDVGPADETITVVE